MANSRNIVISSSGDATPLPAATEQYFDTSAVDFDVLFNCNPEYVCLEQHLKVLQDQLDQSISDIERLQELKGEALESPEDFLTVLKRPAGDGDFLHFPKLQRIMRCPDLDLRRYQNKITRRSNSKFDQNLDYLVGRVMAVQKQLPLMSAASLSSQISVVSANTGVAKSTNNSSGHGKPPMTEMRSKFMQSLDTPTHAPSIPGNIINAPSVPVPTKTSSIAEWDAWIYPNRPTSTVPEFSSAGPVSRATTPALTDTGMTVHQPKPRMALRLSASTLLSSTTTSATATPMNPPTPVDTSNSDSGRSSVVSNGQRKRKYIAAPENASVTHNVPWSEDEKRKLEYLLTVYPEEEIQARRYAKISAALGTRTPNQVASRVQKLIAKEQRQAAKIQPGKNNNTTTKRNNEVRDLPPSMADTESLQELEKYFSKSKDPNITKTPEYQEYLRLRNQLSAIAQNPLNGVLHYGFKCDSCGLDPIIGARWYCVTCPKDAPPVDLCRECVNKGYQTSIHKISHVMSKVEYPDSLVNTSDSKNEFSFLYN